VSSLLKKRIPNRTWARIHLLSFLAYILATVHFLQAGTERTNPIVLLSVEVVTALVLYLTLVRILAPRRARKAGRAGKAGAQPKNRSITSPATPTSTVPSAIGASSRDVAT
jgi:DMSO/TMAO reductase YedYZ heme-binding membrane subunit